MREIYCWAVLFRTSEKSIDGETSHLVGNRFSPVRTMLFHTRKAARDYARMKYGYIRDRKDLQEHPHGWLVPQVVQVLVTIQVSDSVPVGGQ